MLTDACRVFAEFRRGWFKSLLAAWICSSVGLKDLCLKFINWLLKRRVFTRL